MDWISLVGLSPMWNQNLVQDKWRYPTKHNRNGEVKIHNVTRMAFASITTFGLGKDLDLGNWQRSNIVSGTGIDYLALRHFSIHSHYPIKQTWHCQGQQRLWTGKFTHTFITIICKWRNWSHPHEDMFSNPTIRTGKIIQTCLARPAWLIDYRSITKLQCFGSVDSLLSLLDNSLHLLIEQWHGSCVKGMHILDLCTIACNTCRTLRATSSSRFTVLLKLFSHHELN